MEDEAKEVWLFLEQHAESDIPNPDMQLLLFNMDCHKIALKLLNFPVSTTPKFADAKIREVLLAAYRLLKALCAGFKLTQQALVPQISSIVAQIELKLVCHDITPTGCLIAILKDNPQACLQISDELIRQFVRMAAESKAPRFLRFLRNITGPESHPISRTQLLVIQAISENQEVQLFFDDEEERKERDELIAARDHEVHPRGKLNFHIEVRPAAEPRTLLSPPLPCLLCFYPLV